MRFLSAFCVILLFLCVSLSVSGQNLKYERDRHKGILSMVKEDVKKNYFDPTFKGIDVEAKYKLAVEKLEKAESIGQMSGIIAQFLIDFDDSHLFFVPPGKANKTDYGFDFGMAGDKCFVFGVNKDSDAEKQGLHVGDELYSIEGFAPNREELWKMRYYYFRLRPKPVLKLVAIKPNGKEVEYAINAKMNRGKKVTDLTGEDVNQVIRDYEEAERKSTKQYIYDGLDGVFIWKMPRFSQDPSDVDGIISRAKKSAAMIIDLRGNGGGRVDTVLRLIANVFAQDVKVADEKKRKETKEVIAKSRGKEAFSGKILVLIDSGSASASEVFSRVMQIEKRGQVFGDRSAGAVMESQFFGEQLGLDTVVFFGTSVTVADLIMKDGKSLEKIGIMPDVFIVPEANDLAAKRDVVLAKAVESLGLHLTPEAAGAIFPNTYEDK